MLKIHTVLDANMHDIAATWISIGMSTLQYHLQHASSEHPSLRTGSPTYHMYIEPKNVRSYCQFLLTTRLVRSGHVVAGSEKEVEGRLLNNMILFYTPQGPLAPSEFYKFFFQDLV